MLKFILFAWLTDILICISFLRVRSKEDAVQDVAIKVVILYSTSVNPQLKFEIDGAPSLSIYFDFYLHALS